MTRPITLLICALGGEGGGVLTEWLVGIARDSGFAAQSSSIPGVAQRTGATTYYLEVFPTPLAQLQGRRPVFSLNPVPGALDGLLSSELLETARQIGNGMVNPERTLVISASNRTLTTAEAMHGGDGRTASAPLLELIRQQARAHHLLDMSALARRHGTIVSAVMLGALAGSGLLPFPHVHYESVIRRSGRGAAASLAGFAAACALVGQQRTQTQVIADLLAEQEHSVPPRSALRPDLPPAIEARFPPQVRPMLALGLARVREYQDQAYAELYLRRLDRVLQAERAADAAEVQGFAVTSEMARWLALWMAFDDIVRVADLKSRASRWQRVRSEVKAGDQDLLNVYDHFKPGVPEFAALLPPRIAQSMLRWDARRVAAGKRPWALALKVGSHAVLGMLALRALASLKWLRVRGSRYATEQSMIDQWLAGVLAGTRRHWRLGHEIALCGRLIKGYGSTNERGKQNLLHVLEHLANGADPLAAALAVAAAREAALADEAGAALDATLLQHGAPARPLKEQPIRWQRPPKALAAGKRG